MVCSFAKFLALGLIASEGHGPVSVGASTSTEWKEITGLTAGWPTTGADAIRLDLCKKMYGYYKELKTPASGTDDLGINLVVSSAGEVTVCTTTQFTALKGRMLEEWKQDALTLGSLGLTIDNISNATIAGSITANDSKNVKKLLVKALLTTYQKLNSGTALSPTPSGAWNAQIKAVKEAIWKKSSEEYKKVVGIDYHRAQIDNKMPYTPQLVTLEAETADLVKRRSDDVSAARKNAELAHSIAEKELQRNPSAEIKNHLTTIQVNAQTYRNEDAKTAADASKLFKATEGLLDRAKKIRADREAAETATAWGIFGTIAAAVVAFIVLVSPCVMLNVKEDSWTVKGDEEWTRDQTFYGENYGKDAAGNEIGLKPKSNGALTTLVPVGFLVVGVLAVTRRGLNKRRAQKKAKRVSRAQEKLHEDL